VGSDPKPSELRLVEVEWIDSMEIPSWRSPHEMRDAAADELDMLCHSVGWLIEETDAYVLLVSNIQASGEGVSSGMAIPRFAVVKLRDLR
jgi:hypothetical protein